MATRPTAASLSADVAAIAAAVKVQGEALTALLLAQQTPAVPAKLETAIVASSVEAERKSRASNRKGGPSQVAKASAEPTAEDLARRRFEAQIARYSAIAKSPTATDADRRDAAKLSARLTHWLADRGSYVAAMSLWGTPAPAEMAAREARTMAREARKARKVAKPSAPVASSPDASTVTLAELLAMGCTVVAPNGAKVSA